MANSSKITSYNIPENLRQTILNVHGKAGQKWLHAFPILIESLSNKYNFKIKKRYKNLSFNYVASVILKNGDVFALKCGVPDKEFKNEINALRYYDGNGAVKFFAANAKRGWLLEELCFPGKNLLSLNDDTKATHIALEVMSKLWQVFHSYKSGNLLEAPNSKTKFSTITELLTGLDKLQKYSKIYPIIFPKNLIDFVLSARRELLSSKNALILLHGDLHHYNILSNRGSWLAIDPKGIIGEKEYEIATFMRNPGPYLLTTMNTKKVILRRLDQIVEYTGFDRERIILWSIVNAVLATWWCIEDKIPGKDYLLSYSQVLCNIYKNYHPV